MAEIPAHLLERARAAKEKTQGELPDHLLARQSRTLPPPPPPTREQLLEQRVTELEVDQLALAVLVVGLTKAVNMHQENFVRLAPVVDAIGKIIMSVAGIDPETGKPREQAAAPDHRNSGGYA